MNLQNEIRLTTWSQVRDAFRSKDLRQAGYTEGAVVTAGTLLDLHGKEHRARRRIENRLFRRATFSHWEHEVLGATIEATLQPFIDQGHGDLAQIGYRAAMNLTAMIAGVDIDPLDTARTDELYSIVAKLSEGATLMHSTRPKSQVRSEVRSAMEHLRASFYEPSLARRRVAVEHYEHGSLAEDQLDADVLTTLLVHGQQLALEPEIIFREICFYLQAGAHSTANAFTHTIDEILSWREHVDKTTPLDLAMVQRCMHESLRLHPASPVAFRTPLNQVVLSDGTVLAAHSLVVLDLQAANQDPNVFGADSHTFDPHRSLPSGIARWGMSFGAGMHACVGAELDGGLEIDDDRPHQDHLYGTVAVIANAFLLAGGRRDPHNPPRFDPGSVRKHFGSYPVLFN